VAQRKSTLETYAFPHLKSIFVRDIAEQDIKRVLATDVENQNGNGHPRPHRARSGLGKGGRLQDGRQSGSLARQPEVMLSKPSQDEESMPALPYRELPAFLAELRRQEGIAARALALS